MMEKSELYEAFQWRRLPFPPLGESALELKGELVFLSSGIAAFLLRFFRQEHLEESDLESAYRDAQELEEMLPRLTTQESIIYFNQYYAFLKRALSLAGFEASSEVISSEWSG